MRTAETHRTPEPLQMVPPPVCICRPNFIMDGVSYAACCPSCAVHGFEALTKLRALYIGIATERALSQGKDGRA